MEAGFNVLFGQQRIIFLYNSFWAHPRLEKFKNKVNHNPRTSDTRLAMADFWVNDNTFQQILHFLILLGLMYADGKALSNGSQAEFSLLLKVIRAEVQKRQVCPQDILYVFYP
jgi:hypothetical protein